MFTSIDIGERIVTEDAKLSSSTVGANRWLLGPPHHEATCSQEVWRKMTASQRAESHYLWGKGSREGGIAFSKKPCRIA